MAGNDHEPQRRAAAGTRAERDISPRNTVDRSVSAADPLSISVLVGNRAAAKAFGATRRSPGMDGEHPIQRIMWAMSDDHLGAVKTLAAESQGMWSYLGGHPPESAAMFGSSALMNDKSTELTLWGHTNGAGTTFGGWDPAGLIDQLRKFGLETPEHRILNIISCSPNRTDDRTITTYAQTVQSLIDDLARPQLKVRTMPMIKEGYSSLLYRNETLKKTMYIVYEAANDNDVRTAMKVYSGAKEWDSLKRRLSELGEVSEHKFSTLLSLLTPVVTPKTHKGGQEDNLHELLVPDVFGGKTAMGY